MRITNRNKANTISTQIVMGMSYTQGAKTYFLPANLLVAMLNTSFLKTHAPDIASDWRIMDNFIFFPTETHLSNKQ